jgi:hypothetical protein
MRARRCVLTFVLALCLLASPLAGVAQKTGKRVPRVGWLSPGNPPSSATPRHVTRKGFLEGLRELGYIEDQTIE